MKNRLLSFLIALPILVCAFTRFGDDDPIKKLLLKLEKLRINFPQEKVHIHTDKPFYAIGDTIWFKAYVVKAEGNELSGLSKTLYVDLINEKDSLKKALLLPVTAGLTWGEFVLTDSLQEGNYRLRAYTSWMRNFGEEFYFDKTFRVANSATNDILTTTSYAFSTEGARDKIESTIAFTDLSGEPISGKELSYDVQLEYRSLAKGKTITDSAGKAKIIFTNNQPFLLKSGRINATLKLDDRTTVRKSIPVTATSNEVSVQFFPEGGQLIENIKSRLAFKALLPSGTGAEVSGQIIDQNNKKVLDFRSENLGMGSFPFTAQPGNTYSAIVRYNGEEKRVELPKAVKEGYALTVNSTLKDSLSVKITASPGLLNTGEVVLVAQSNSVVQYVAKNKLTASSFSATLAKKRFPTGILQFTLFSPELRPIAERLVFIQNDDELSIKITGDKTTYKPREKVKLNLEVRDAAGKPVQGSFSLSVTDQDKVSTDKASETTIFSNLLLSSDLKGYIEKPSYYFRDVTNEKLRQLDNLMLTQGWSRFVWKNLIADAFPNITYTPEQNLAISGRVTTTSDKPAAGAKVLLLSTGGTQFTLDTLTDKEGNFRFNNLFFAEDTRFVVEARSAQDKKNVRIEVDRVPQQLVTKNKNAADVEININKTVLPYLQNSRINRDELKKYGLIRKSILLQEVIVIEKKPAIKNSNNLNGAGNADQVIRGEALATCYSLAQCLEGRLVGVLFRNGYAYSTRGGGIMQIMIDGTFVQPDYLNYIAPADVETIEVLRSGSYLAIYGLRGGNGIIMINTKRGESRYNPDSYARGIASYSPLGYHLSREFYSPDYDNPKTNANMRDLRTTVYWKANIITDANGKASISFFNADAPGTYRTVVEGIALPGSLGRAEYNYSVRK